MRNHTALPTQRFERMKAYLAQHGITLVHDEGHGYELKVGESDTYSGLAYWQANQPYQNVCALVTMKTGVMLPHTPRYSYRCPDCGCNTDAQVEMGPIEGTTRCMTCYSYNCGDYEDD